MKTKLEGVLAYTPTSAMTEGDYKSYFRRGDKLHEAREKLEKAGWLNCFGDKLKKGLDEKAAREVIDYLFDVRCLLIDFTEVNARCLDACEDFPEDKWPKPITWALAFNYSRWQLCYELEISAIFYDCKSGDKNLELVKDLIVNKFAEEGEIPLAKLGVLNDINHVVADLKKREGEKK